MSAALRQRLFSYGVVVPFAIVLAFPFFWMAVTSLKPQNQVFDPAHTWRFSPTLASWGFLLHHTDYVHWLRNSAFVGLLFLPLARVVGPKYLGLSDKLWSLILVYPSFTIPFAVWLLMGFFKTIPQELEDAALIDGCSRLSSLVRIVFPISLPGILTVVIFTFSLVINEFVYAIAFISSSANRTVTVGVPTDLIRGDLFNWPGIMAAILIPSIPLALVYNAFLNRFIAGFTGGAFR
jgi:multiple sugar transport system permease protein